MLMRRESIGPESRRESLSRRLQAVADIRRREEPRLPVSPQAYGELRLVKLDEAAHTQDAA